ncbi:MAG TPA: hypothetical protein VLA56_08575 [Pseudomonadales bacterium]|nr:hypothetical protein [Pseudomonadales bacterium]
MKATTLTSWLEIAANVGIIGGLLLVAVQISQNDTIAAVTIEGDLYDSVTEAYSLLAGEDPAASLARAIDDPAALDTRDHVVLSNLMNAEFARLARMEGLLRPDDVVPDSIVERWVGDLLSNPYGHAWWETNRGGRLRFVPRMSAAIDAGLTAAGADNAHAARRAFDAIDDQIARPHDHARP